MAGEFEKDWIIYHERWTKTNFLFKKVIDNNTTTFKQGAKDHLDKRRMRDNLRRERRYEIN